MAQIGTAQAKTAVRQLSVLAARIAVSARGPGNAPAARPVIARVSPQSRSYAVLSWRGESE